MTTPDERMRAVQCTREFLQALVNLQRTPRVPQAVREHARTLLRHYPSSGVMNLVGTALPNWFSALNARETDESSDQS